MIVDNTRSERPQKFYYNFQFYKTSKTSFGINAQPRGDEGVIISHDYFFSTNDKQIPKEKFEEIEKFIANIINGVD